MHSTLALLAAAAAVALPSSLGFSFSPGVPALGLRAGRVAPQATRSAPRFAKAAPTLRMSGGSVTKDAQWALLFDCDGVIVETEELHRLAYNGAFKELGCTVGGKQVEWIPKYYDVLQNTVGGGKPKMKWSFGNEGWPDSTLGLTPPTIETTE
ncbi:hypothetical protein T484DRAFT_1855681 [Baffinella frigidus]|nr:hypothetical protein T484DRAFT_1855681 [Cryptophyta sp. CCMP2293]